MKADSVLRSTLIDYSELGNLYQKYRTDFIRFARMESTLSEEDIKDIYQELFLAICKRKRNLEIFYSFKTYLFAAGKRCLREGEIAQRKLGHEELESWMDEFESQQSENWEKAQQIAYQVVIEMKEPCNQILLAKYWDDKNMRTIAEENGYKNEQVAKNKKRSCIEKLSSYLRKKLREEELL